MGGIANWRAHGRRVSVVLRALQRHPAVALDGHKGGRIGQRHDGGKLHGRRTHARVKFWLVAHLCFCLLECGES